MSGLSDQLEAAADVALPDKDLVRLAEQRGYIIHKPAPPREPVELDIGRIKGDRVRIGILSDPHFGSKWQQATYFREHAELMAREGCTAIIIAGDVTDGATSMHPGFEYGLWALGYDAQKRAALEGIPEVGVPWYLIGGNHDASHYKAAGADIIKAICDERDDLHYLGPEQNSKSFVGSIGYLTVGEVLVQVCHPHLGGTRVRSYRLETWIENLSPPKPSIVVMGNFHKMVEIFYRGVWGLLVPSFQAQTAWMASKAIESIVGGAIIEFGTVTKGLASEMTVHWIIEREVRVNDWPGGR